MDWFFELNQDSVQLGLIAYAGMMNAYTKSPHPGRGGVLPYMVCVAPKGRVFQPFWS